MILRDQSQFETKTTSLSAPKKSLLINVARKLPGVVQKSLRGANKQNVSETPPPKRPSNGSSNEALDLHETSAAKESELNLGSVRLALHGRLSGRALAELLELCFERSHSAVNFL